MPVGHVRGPTKMKKCPSSGISEHSSVDRGENVCESFNDQFPNSERRRLPGLQYKLYRFLKRRNYPSMRGKRQIIDRKIAPGEPAPALRVIEWTKTWYLWMGESKNPSFNRSSPPQDLP
ncbi:hypothetical protein N7450_011702 [Penicillium hetheringtonii]|uniref:Uncharacterized protein n=1 Tax=Penicillium hetheringtonii TaxID=911720 RepID=A0AAD6DAF8_9EURO|nr:hypothetical protein N7450_011702 [Penicillium hetheringtonii]